MPKLAAAILAVLLATFATAALAQTAAEREACKADTQKFCPGIMPGGGRILACLAKDKSKLSEACRKVVESHGM